MSIIHSLLNNPGERSLETIAKLNQCTVLDIELEYLNYVDACKHAMSISCEPSEIADANETLMAIMSAWRDAKSCK